MERGIEENELNRGEEVGRECPDCHSKRIRKDGIRETSNSSVQRFRCRDCGLRFSENSYKECLTNEDRQLCALLEAKKLDTATETRTVVGEENSERLEINGKIVQFAIALKNKGRSPETIRTYVASLKTLLNKGANLKDPACVESVIAKQNWTIRAKRNYADWYARFAKFLCLSWEKPVYKAPDRTPFIPLESEIDQLISGSSKKVSIALQIGKETAARIGEVLRIKWIDIDFQADIIAINEPEKGSNTGIYKVSKGLIARILTLPRTSDRIFGRASTDSITNMLTTVRRRLATSFCNPRLLQIHFHTLRHWKLTTYAHKIKDPFMVQMFARHKDIKCTMRYVHLEKIIYQEGNSDEWIVKAAKSVDEASEFLKVGFEYVTEIDGFKLFRKRK